MAEPLERASEILPELEGETAPKKLWRQPVFLVSAGLAVIAILGVGTALVLQSVFRAPDKVENLAISDTGTQYYVQWDGPNVPYSVIMTGSGKPADISHYVKGRSIWVPKSQSHVDGDSCFVVRSLAAAQENPATKADVIRSQGGQKVCVSDAKVEKK